MRIINRTYGMVPVGDLRTHPRNPRHGDVDSIAESVRENGFFGVIVAQESTGSILAGNHTYLAAIKEGASEVPVIHVECSDEEALRILLVDNRASDLAHYDDAMRGLLLQELMASAQGLLGSGYDADDAAALLASFEADDDKDDGGEPGEADPRPYTLTVFVHASEHVTDATHAVATLLEEHPEWRAQVG